MIQAASPKHMLERYIDGFNRGDVEALLSLFANDAVIEDPVGSPPRQANELREWFTQGVAMSARLELDAPIRGSHGRAAAMAFRVSMLQDGVPVVIHSLDTIELNDQGLIIKLRGYWGPEDVESQT